MNQQSASVGNNTIDQQLLDQAATWIVRLNSDQCRGADKKRFSQWIEKSPKHGAAFDQLLDTWEIAKYTSVSAVSAQTADTETPKSLFSWNPALSWSSAVAACLCLVVLVISFTNNDDASKQFYQTGKGELLSVHLPDGSTVELNTNSSLDVDFSEELRSLSLKGEAYFSVASDKSRPFTVNIGSASVTAVGTQFNIYKNTDASHIWVTEGTIKVVENTQHKRLIADKTLVHAGERVSVDRRTGLGEVSSAAADIATAWRNQTMVFEDTPLTVALEQLNRYLQKPVDTSDRSLKELRVSGTFSLDQPEATLQALIEAFKLQESALDDKLSLELRQ